MAASKVPEITWKSTILAIILTIILSASTVFLGLKVGLTVSASIPAAVAAMGILSLFKSHTVQENNIVQTAASGGMSLVSGLIFIVPALVILGIWQEFNYWQTVFIGLVGGILGVLFSVPVRKILLDTEELHFPEGTAIGNVLNSTIESTKSLKDMIKGGIISSLIVFGQTGLKIISEGASFWFKGKNIVAGFSLGFSPVLFGAGFIVGPHTCFAIFVGIVFAWIIGVPAISYFHDLVDPLKSAQEIVSLAGRDYIRYVGVGLLITGGLWTFIILLNPLYNGVKKSFQSLNKKGSKKRSTTRTEKDIPISVVSWMILGLTIPLACYFFNVVDMDKLGIGPFGYVLLSFIAILFSIILGFIISVICGYIVGLVGSSASPISALGLASIISISLVVLFVMGGPSEFVGNAQKAINATTISLLVGAIILAAAAITNDTIQDMKVGRMVKATPWKQQVMQMLGVVVAAFLVPTVMQLLYEAYGIGNVVPRVGMDIAKTLSAPQAQLMATVAKGVFSLDVPWELIAIGVIAGVLLIVFDNYLKSTGRQGIQTLAVGLGVYLPLEASTPILLGGIVAYLVESRVSKSKLDDANQRGFIFSSGVIAGGALVGILLAIPFVYYQDIDVLAVVSSDFDLYAKILGLIAFFYICRVTYKISLNKK